MARDVEGLNSGRDGLPFEVRLNPSEVHSSIKK
jgi:hypothetical protein